MLMYNIVNEDHVYTVHADYFATGEGTTYMVVITRGYGPNEPKENALNRFRELFGDYMATGATVTAGLYFDFVGNKVLLSDELRKKLTDWNNDAGGLEWHSRLHLNFS
jgi:hypothetical protein